MSGLTPGGSGPDGTTTPADSPFATPPEQPVDVSGGGAGNGSLNTGLAMADANLTARATGAPDPYATAATIPAPAGPAGQTGNTDGTLPQGVSLGQSDLARRAAQLYGAFPDLKNQPALVTQLIQMPVTDDALVGSVGKSQAAASASALFATLNGLSDAKARAQVWGKLTQPVQQSLLAMGMTPPADPTSHGGGWLDVLGSLVRHNPVTLPWDVGSNLVQGHFQKALSGGVADTVGTLGTGIGAAGRAIGTDIIKPAAGAVGLGGAYKDVSGALGTVMGTPSHLYRALEYDPQTGARRPPGILSSPDSSAPVTNPGAPDNDWTSWHWFSKAWDATGKGKPFYTDNALAQLNKALPGDTELQQLAEQVAINGGDLTAGVYSYLGKTPAGTPAQVAAYKAKATQLLGRAAPDGHTPTPQFATAVSALTGSGVSWGRDTARYMGLRPGSTGFADVSGGADAIFSWYLNPLVAAGRVRGLTEGARAMSSPAEVMAELDRMRLSNAEATRLQSSLGSSRDVSFWGRLTGVGLPESYTAGNDAGVLQRLVRPADSVARIRLLASLAAHTNDGNVAGWVAAFPHSVDMIHNFTEWAHGPDGPIARAGTTGATHGPLTVNDTLDWMHSKSAAWMVAQGAGDTYLHDSDLQLPRLTRAGLRIAQTKLALTPAARLADTAIPPEWLDESDPHRVGSTFAGLSNSVHQLFRPANTARVVHLTGDDSLSSYEKFLSQFNLPDWLRASKLQLWTTANGMAARRVIMRDTLAAGLRRTSLGRSSDGQLVIDRMVLSLDHSYDPTGLGRDVTGSGAKAALEPDSQAAESMYAPGLRDIAQAAHHIQGLSVVNGGLLNGALETYIHRFWAPMALFRVGFIPRVVSEEWLTALMRLAPTQIASAYLGEMLPAAQDRFASWDTYRGDATPSFGRILAAHAFDHGPMSKVPVIRHANAPAMVRQAGFETIRALTNRVDPDIVAAGTAVRSARLRVKAASRAWHDLVDAVGDRTEAAHIVGVQNLDRYFLDRTGQLRFSHDPDHTLATEVKKKRDALRQAFEVISDDPIVRRAWGKAVFSTGGSYRSSSSIGDELDPHYQAINPIEQLKIGNVRRLFHNVRATQAADPGFRQAVADYYGEKARSETYRVGMGAIQGWLPSEGEQLKLQALLPADERGGNLAETVQAVRERFASLPAAGRDSVRDYLTALATDDREALHYTGRFLYQMLGDGGLSAAQKSLLEGLLGRREYWRKVVEPRHDPITSTDEQVQLGDHPGAPDFLTASHILADPAAAHITSRSEGVDAAAEAMYAHLTSDTFDQSKLMDLDHIIDGQAGPLAEKVAPGRRRIYFIDPGRPWSDEAATWSDWDRHALDFGREPGWGGHASPADQRLPELGLHSVATDDPARAEDWAKKTGVPLQYVDLPEAVAAAQKIGDAHGAHETSPWKQWSGRRARETQELAGHLRFGADMDTVQTAQGAPGRTYWLDRAQAGAASTLDGQVTRLADGTLAPGVSLSTAVRNHARTMAEDLVDAVAPHGQLLQPIVQGALRHEGQRTFTVQHLAGIPDNLLPEVVQAAQHTTLDPDKFWDRVVAAGFDRVLGPSIDSMVRSPLFIRSYARGLRAARILEPHLVDTDLRSMAHATIKGSHLDARWAREALRQKAEYDDATAGGAHFGEEETQARFPLLKDAENLIQRAQDTQARLPRRFEPPEHPWFFHGSPDASGGIQPVAWQAHQLDNLYGPGFYTTDTHQVAEEYAGLRDPGGNHNPRPEPNAGIHQVTWGLSREPRFVDLEAPAERHVKDAAATVLQARPGLATNWTVNIPGGGDWDPLGGIRSAQTNGEVLEYVRDALAMAATPEEGLGAWRQLHTILANQGYDGLAHVGGGRVRGDSVRHNVRIFFDTHPLVVSTKETDAYSRAMHAWSDMEDHVDDQLRQAAVVRAIKDTVPFINNHNARTNFTELARNVAPFLWAQESFYKRWWRANLYNPAQMAKLELGLHGLGAAGITHKNSSGQSVLTLPGSAQLSHALTSVGVPYSVAQAIPFTMEVKNMTPGFNRPAAPAWGPLVSVPVGLLGVGSPSETPLMQAVDGAGTAPGWPSLVGEMVPSGTVRNLFNALVPTADPQAYASAQMSALQLLAAGGHLPGESASPQEVTTYTQRLTAWTRNVMLLRAALGFFTPATPTLDFNDMTAPGGEPVGQLNGDLRDLIAMFGVTDGVQRFAAMHPDATPYTIFRATSAGLSSPPATAAALDMLQSHQDFFDAHPLAGAYFLPAPGANDLYSKAALAAEQAAGLRRNKGWTQIVTEMAAQAASSYYYAAHDEYLKEFAAADGDRVAQVQITRNWATFSKAVTAANPLFANELNSSTSSATRADVVADVRSALADGHSPQGAQTDHLRQMISVYDAWSAARTNWAGDRTGRAAQARTEMDRQFAQWAQSYVATYPDVEAFWSRIVAPEITAADKSVGQDVEGTLLSAGAG